MPEVGRAAFPIARERHPNAPSLQQCFGLSPAHQLNDLFLRFVRKQNWTVLRTGPRETETLAAKKEEAGRRGSCPLADLLPLIYLVGGF